MEEREYLICNDCGWTGDDDDLVDDDNTGKYDQCPSCGCRGFLRDIEEIDGP